MLTHEFVIHGHEDKCIYNKFYNNEGVIICLYVDDLLIFGTSHNVVHDTKSFLASKFDMKDLDRKSTRLNSSHVLRSRMPSSA